MKKQNKPTDRVMLKNQSDFSKILFMIFFLAVLVLTIYIIKPFIATIILSATIAYVLYPLYLKVYSKIKLKGVSAALILFVLILICSIAIFGVTSALTKESYSLYKEFKETYKDNNITSVECATGNGIFCTPITLLGEVKEKYNFDVEQTAENLVVAAAGIAVSKVSDVLKNIPKLFLHIFIGVFAVFYMLVDGHRMIVSLKSALPLDPEDSNRIFSQFNDIIYATINGAIIIAIVQGIVAGIGYFIFGVTSPVVLMLLTIIASFIPFVGAAIVWLPVSISQFINGLVIGDNSIMLKAVGLFLYCILIVSTLDNFIRPRIVGKRANIHPLVILLGVFGGISVFGFAGIVVGPLLLTLFFASLKIYQHEKAIKVHNK